ncbi:MAG: hypothetical protein GY835_25330 [bacterium]|nr:hypothetical protein [bacterium]
MSSVNLLIAVIALVIGLGSIIVSIRLQHRRRAHKRALAAPVPTEPPASSPIPEILDLVDDADEKMGIGVDHFAPQHSAAAARPAPAAMSTTFDRPDDAAQPPRVPLFAIVTLGVPGVLLLVFAITALSISARGHELSPFIDGTIKTLSGYILGIGAARYKSK